MTRTELAVAHAVSRDGTRIGYWSGGEGPPLVLVHGALGDHARWDALRPYLEAHATVHAMDRRGRGASGDGPEYAIEREVEDVVAVADAVAEASGQGIDVAGSSAGASIAVSAAAMTESIRRLVLFEPPTEAVLAALPEGLPDRMDALLERGDREEVLRTAYRELVGLTDAEIEVLRSQSAWPGRVAAAHTVPRELRVPPDRVFDPARAAEVAVPALVLVGGATPEPFRVSAEAVAAALPDARVALIEGQGHAAEMLAPERVAEEILAFLGEGP